ncbi:MAG: preprotein translocase subunit Sec61beta [Desulfurococcaceae archaeon]|nr:preprotein translocase subunit Sec61beta [Desulfurococcaceae archaeon]
MSKRRDKKSTPGIASAAGLIRFYEEIDSVITIKPHLLIALSIIFTVIIIILSKILPVT